VLPGVDQTAIVLRGVSAWQADLVENLAKGKVEMTTRQQDAQKAEKKTVPPAAATGSPPKAAPAPKQAPKPKDIQPLKP